MCQSATHRTSTSTFPLTLIPSLLDPDLYQLYSSAIYAKLEEDGALSTTITAY
jgi:hypothetical protein